MSSDSFSSPTRLRLTEKFKSDKTFDTPAALKSLQRTSTSSSKLKPQPPPSSSQLLEYIQPTKTISAKSSSADNAVIVFGMQPENKEVILQRLRNIGEIVDVQPGKGNWATITYKAKDDAARALALNGQILMEGTMIGVKPARSEDILFLDRSSLSSTYEEIIHTNQYIRRTPRRNAPFWEKVLHYFLNWD